MSTTVTLNGVSYAIPATGENSWGDAVTSYLVALGSGVLQKAGGSFTLTAEVDFGATYGVKSAYYKSRGTNPASAGEIRLANAEYVKWRNAANGGDLGLRVNSSDALEFNGSPISALALGTANQVLGMNSGATAQEYKTVSGTSNQVNVTHGTNSITLSTPQSIAAASSPTFAGLTLTAFSGVVKATAGVLSAASIVNADIDAAAAIAYSKLALTGSVTNADLAGSIAYSKLSLTGAILNADLAGSIAYSKLSLTGTIVNADVSASAAIAYSKLALTGTIVNADVSGSAAIAYSKLNLSGSIATGDLAAALLVPIGKGGTGQTTAAAAFAALSPLTTKGDISTYSTTTARLGVGSDGQVLTADSAQTTGLKWAAGASATVAQYNTDIGDSTNTRTPTNTNLLGDVLAQTRSQTATMTIAAPGVVTSNSHGMALGDKFYFTTTGALPTGVSASTTYYASNIAANTFNISTTLANAVAGTYVTTSGSQSGTHTLFMGGMTKAGYGNAAEATKQGQFLYLADKSGGGNDIGYNGGTKATISETVGSGTLNSVDLAQLIPYQVHDGTWRCKFNISITMSSTARTAVRLAINGWASSATAAQGVTGWAPATAITYAVSETGGTLLSVHASVSTTAYHFSGDIKLNAKPSWAY